MTVEAWNSHELSQKNHPVRRMPQVRCIFAVK